LKQEHEIGRVLRAGTRELVVGCRVARPDTPALGSLIRAPVGPDQQAYALIHEIRIDDDGLVRQLVSAEHITDEVMLDNRERRIVPVEMSAAVVGSAARDEIRHHLPGRPPMSLDPVYLCSAAEVQRFTSLGRFGYFRHLLHAPEVPLGELLAAHVGQAAATHPEPAAWTSAAVGEIVSLLRDDHALLASVLAALDDIPHGAFTENSDI
jgi:hypothetical protein